MPGFETLEMKARFAFTASINIDGSFYLLWGDTYLSACFTLTTTFFEPTDHSTAFDVEGWKAFWSW